MEQTKKECRAFSFTEVRSSEEIKGQLVGRAIVLEQETDLGGFTETIDRDALKDTDLHDVRFLVNHNTDMVPLARSRNNNANSTMQMTVDDDGLLVRVNLDIDGNPEAASLYSAISRGDVSGMSFMYNVIRDKWEGLETDKPSRRILEIGKVFEVSAVTFPAYEQTTIEAASCADALERAKATLESAKAEARRSEAINNLKARLESHGN